MIDGAADAALTRGTGKKTDELEVKKEKPNFKLSGKLQQAANICSCCGHFSLSLYICCSSYNLSLSHSPTCLILPALPERNGVKLKWMEPPDAAKPNKRWRLYPFKGEEALGTRFSVLPFASVRAAASRLQSRYLCTG
jgi:hypothetical protein